MMTILQRARQRKRDTTIPDKPPLLRVIPFSDWCKLRGFSEATGRRIIKSGRVKITDLSARRIGIREDHDREYLDSCVRGGA